MWILLENDQQLGEILRQEKLHSKSKPTNPRSLMISKITLSILQAGDGKGKRERLAIGKNEKKSSESTKKDATKAAKTEPRGSDSGWPIGLNRKFIQTK